ncbi:MAG: type II secretion system F family protein [Planctomycetales bacterium]|nr:type II secretion system F family protein [Planctomycetales bacterium]
MPEFTYTARDHAGTDIVGTLSAATRREAVTQLTAKALLPLKVELKKASLALTWKFEPRIRTEVMATTLTQLGDLLENGVSLLDALQILAEQSPHPRLGEVLGDVHHQVAEGVSLDIAMSRHPRIFSELTVSLVRAGMEGAFLEDSLRRIAGFLERQEALKSKVMGAMAYPAFLATVGTIVTVVLVVFFVPKFEGLFERMESMGNGLPPATVALLWLSDTLSQYWYLILGSLIMLFIAARAQWEKENVRRRFDEWKLRIPLVGEIFHNAAVSRFCRVLGTLLHNGVPILKSLSISSESSGNRLLADAIMASAQNVSAGESLAQPLAQSKLLPKSVMAMIAVAEESNSLDTVLVKISDRIDEKIERRLALLVRLIEPIMLVLIGGAVMFILIALLLPVMDAGSVVN